MTRCIDAWNDLGTCRAIGMTVGPIPWTAIDAWATRHHLDDEAALILINVIRMVDNDRAASKAAKDAAEATRGKARR